MNVPEESVAADSGLAAGSASKTGPTPSPALGRGLPSVNRASSLQQRASRVLALALATAIGMALLGWYYTHAFRNASAEPARAAMRGASSDVPLPPLDGIASALAKARSPGRDPLADEGGSASSYVIGSVVGDPPPLGTLDRVDYLEPGGESMGSTGAPPATPPVDRRLTGSVFVGGNGTALPLNTSGVNTEGAAVVEASIGAAADSNAANAPSFSQQIKTPLTPAVLARRLPTLRFLLPRGAFIDCTLETAVDSSLPGLVTCLTATDIFGADGRVVLLERGTRLVGETRGEVRAGSARVYIVWTEARTPTGVVAELDSPATDALGRAGVAGAVDRHFWDRFGAAMLLSMIDGAVLSASSHQTGGTTVVTGGTATTEVLGEVLKSTVNIPPTVTIAEGTRVQALVARDIDFRRVYELRDLTAGP